MVPELPPWQLRALILRDERVRMHGGALTSYGATRLANQPISAIRTQTQRRGVFVSGRLRNLARPARSGRSRDRLDLEVR
jgi:hypothetical protein